MPETQETEREFVFFMSLPCMGFGSILDLITSASLCGGCLVGLMNERFDELNGF